MTSAPMRIYFTNHARQRLMERHGVKLSREEETFITDALALDLGGADAGSYRMDVIVPGRIKFQAVVHMPAGAIVTTLQFNSARISPKRRSRERLRDDLDRSIERDMRHMHARQRRSV